MPRTKAAYCLSVRFIAIVMCAAVLGLTATAFGIVFKQWVENTKALGTNLFHATASGAATELKEYLSKQPEYCHAVTRMLTLDHVTNLHPNEIRRKYRNYLMSLTDNGVTNVFISDELSGGYYWVSKSAATGNFTNGWWNRTNLASARIYPNGTEMAVTDTDLSVGNNRLYVDVLTGPKAGRTGRFMDTYSDTYQLQWYIDPIFNNETIIGWVQSLFYAGSNLKNYSTKLSKAVGYDSSVFFFNQQYSLLGASNMDPVPVGSNNTVSRYTVFNSSDETIRVIGNQISKQENPFTTGRMSVKVGGKKQLVSKFAIEYPGLTWMLVVVTPEEKLLHDVNKVVLWVMIVGIILALVVIVALMSLLGVIVLPLQRLANNMLQFSMLDTGLRDFHMLLDDQPSDNRPGPVFNSSQILEQIEKMQKLKSYFYEIAVVVDAFDVMCRYLQDAISKLLAETKRANEAVAAQAQFLCHTSHEIRTPLFTILMGCTELNRLTLPESQAGQELHMIHAAAQHLLAMMNDVLDISKITAGALVLEKVKMSMLSEIETCLDSLRPIYSAKHVPLHVQYSPMLPKWVQGDPLRFRQIIINLLHNACKFTQVGRVEMKVLFTKPPESSNSSLLTSNNLYSSDRSRSPASLIYNRQSSGSSLSSQPGRDRSLNVTFLLTDTGCGIHQDALAKMFEQFHQDKLANNPEGCGLGLSISRNLCRLMGGDIDIQSTVVGKGTTFKVVIPFSLVEQEMPAPTCMPRSNLFIVVPSDDDVHYCVNNTHKYLNSTLPFSSSSQSLGDGCSTPPVGASALSDPFAYGKFGTPATVTACGHSTTSPPSIAALVHNTHPHQHSQHTSLHNASHNNVVIHKPPMLISCSNANFTPTAHIIPPSALVYNTSSASMSFVSNNHHLPPVHGNNKGVEFANFTLPYSASSFEINNPTSQAIEMVDASKKNGGGKHQQGSLDNSIYSDDKDNKRDGNHSDGEGKQRSKDNVKDPNHKANGSNASATKTHDNSPAKKLDPNNSGGKGTNGSQQFQHGNVPASASTTATCPVAQKQQNEDASKLPYQMISTGVRQSGSIPSSHGGGNGNGGNGNGIGQSVSGTSLQRLLPQHLTGIVQTTLETTLAHVKGYADELNLPYVKMKTSLVGLNATQIKAAVLDVIANTSYPARHNPDVLAFIPYGLNCKSNDNSVDDTDALPNTVNVSSTAPHHLHNHIHQPSGGHVLSPPQLQLPPHLRTQISTKHNSNAIPSPTNNTNVNANMDNANNNPFLDNSNAPAAALAAEHQLQLQANPQLPVSNLYPQLSNCGTSLANINLIAPRSPLSPSTSSQYSDNGSGNSGTTNENILDLIHHAHSNPSSTISPRRHHAVPISVAPSHHHASVVELQPNGSVSSGINSNNANNGGKQPKSGFRIIQIRLTHDFLNGEWEYATDLTVSQPNTPPVSHTPSMSSPVLANGSNGTAASTVTVTVETLGVPCKPSSIFIHMNSDVTSTVVQQQEQLRGLNGTKILVVDDNRVNLTMLQRMLVSLGCDVTGVANGRDAVQMFQLHNLGTNLHPFDVILMDVLMPELDGIEATKLIRELEKMHVSNSAPRHVPIIAVTANAFAEDKLKCLKAGMNDYLSKPFTPLNLHGAISKMLEEGDGSATRSHPARS